MNCDDCRLLAVTFFKVIVSDASSVITVFEPDCEIWLNSADQLAKSLVLNIIWSVRRKAVDDVLTEGRLEHKIVAAARYCERVVLAGIDRIAVAVDGGRCAGGNIDRIARQS